MAELFDTYSRKARLYPAFLAALPIATYLIAANGKPAAVDLWLPVLGTLGVQFFLASFVRSRGKALETSTLIPKWSGMPTTSFLRSTCSVNSVQRNRWRSQLEKLTARSLPTPQQDSSDPSSSDEHYVAATRLLISRVRLTNRHPRVQEENTNYGFARNLLALKPIAIAILALAIASDVIAILLSSDSLRFAVLLGIHVIFVGAWIIFVKEPWVRQVADAYANRLFEALDDPEIVEQ